MAATCPSCGEDAVVWEEYTQQVTDGKPQQVCTECGLIVEEGCYTSGDTQGTSDVKANRHLYDSSLPSAYLRRNQTERESKVKKAYEKVIEELGRLFDLPTDIVERSKELFGIVYKSTGFHGVAVGNKNIIAGCCLFAICRMRNIPMLFKFFADSLNCTKEKFSKEIKRLVDITDIKIPHQDISEYVDGYCRKLGVTETVRSSTFDIIEVAKNTWISQGRNTEFLLEAAVYIAWVAEDPTSRLKTSLQKFRVRHDAVGSSPKVVKQRYLELITALCKLAKEIPWVDVKCADLKTAVFNLKDIARYQESLIHEASARVSKQLSEELSDIEKDVITVRSPPATPQDTDVTIVARHLPSNTETTTELSLVATVTEHTDLNELQSETNNRKNDTETDSDASSEEGHQYSIIVSPRIEEKTEDPFVKSPELGQLANIETFTEDGRIEVNKTVEKNNEMSCQSNSGIKRQKSITEGSVCVDKKRFEAWKALPISARNTESRASLHNSVNTTENNPESSDLLHADCDNRNTAQNSTDESHHILSKTNLCKRKRKKTQVQIEEGRFLPKAFIVARQTSREAKRARVENSTHEDNDEIKKEVSNEEIDQDIEQYIRTEDEIKLLKQLYAKKS